MDHTNTDWQVWQWFGVLLDKNRTDVPRGVTDAVWKNGLNNTDCVVVMYTPSTSLTLGMDLLKKLTIIITLKKNEVTMETKKQLKEEYKQMKFRMGVFQLRNTVNGKALIGSNTNLDAIWNRHKFQLESGNHPNASLQQDWNASGPENIRHEILAEIEQKDGEATDYNKELKLLEAMYIDELKPFGEKGYNIEKL